MAGKIIFYPESDANECWNSQDELDATFLLPTSIYSLSEFKKFVSPYNLSMYKR